MAYCDTNILTSFINRQRLAKTLGSRGFEKFAHSIKAEKRIGESQAQRENKCVVSRKALVNDIGRHEPSMGAILTSSGYGKVNVIDVDGIKRGRKSYNIACEKGEEISEFNNNFCEGKRLKPNKDLTYNQINDINHWGSAELLNEKEFVTANKKDFLEVSKFSDIKLK